MNRAYPVDDFWKQFMQNMRQLCATTLHANLRMKMGDNILFVVKGSWNALGKYDPQQAWKEQAG